jgi:ubiquinone/menaquinone biosynthesis C-methylase UbiE
MSSRSDAKFVIVSTIVRFRIEDNPDRRQAFQRSAALRLGWCDWRGVLCRSEQDGVFERTSAMSSTETKFTGSIPEFYDRYMVPMLFAPYAQEIAKRAKALAPGRILETAAGTGIVTRALHDALPEAELVATDLNEPMLERAALRVDSDAVSFQPADALDLPFEDGSFDLVVCQFGVMFFPDKVAGNSEARRVLGDGGHYLLAIWDRLERNAATNLVAQTVAQIFPADAAKFYERVPFRYHERSQIEHDLRSAGFQSVDIETVELSSRSASARDAAIGLVQGTPVRAEIEQIDPDMVTRATDVAAEALKQFVGPDGFSAPMSAHIVTAAR